MSTKNYMTPQGANRLKEELRHLRDVERPDVVKVVAWAASNGDRSENADYIYGKRRLREIDRRIEFLTQRLSMAEVVDPTRIQSEQIRFGATVTIEDQSSTEKTYTIVGADETEIEKNRISWLSPMGKALMGKSVGDEVSFQTPGGIEQIVVLKVQYIALE